MNDDPRPDDAPTPEVEPAPGAEPADAPSPPDASAEAGAGEGGASGDDETSILRNEIALVQAQLEQAQSDLEAERDRALRARAELDTVRRRAAGEEARARDAGFDAAVLPVMQVADDLRRALEAADQGDPADIVPGVRAVMEGLERELGKLGVERVGEIGETFDPDRHEALSSVPAGDDGAPGTIAQVFEAGYVRGDRLVRPARVVVYQD